MKSLVSFLLLTLAVACHAETDGTHECPLTSKKLSFITPTSDNIANAFWQTGTDGYESVDRLHIVYKNGSVAVVEHKYCSMYNLEIAYYANKMDEFSDIKRFEETLKHFFTYSAIQDADGQKAISAMTKRFIEKGFRADSALTTGYEGSTQDNKRAEYSLSYVPVEDSSIHKAALFIYMGIGGEH